MRYVSRLLIVIRSACRRAARTISRHLSYFLVVLLLSAVAGCATTGIKGVLRGQTKEEVLALLGPPSTVQAPLVPLIGTEIWIWASPIPDGRVERKIVMWNRDQKVSGAHIFFKPIVPAPKE